jgi:hypothetical protein
MTESTLLENIETVKNHLIVDISKLKYLSHFKRGTKLKCCRINSLLLNHFSDKNTSYVNFSELVDAHITSKSTKETTKTTLIWVHIAINNAKRNLLGVYHMIKPIYLQ